MTNSNPLTSSKHHLRLSGFIEGISFLLLLFIAMPLKYWADMREAVTVTGMIHGILFIWYIVSIMWARMESRINSRNAMIAFVASLVPFGTFYADKRIFREIKD